MGTHCYVGVQGTDGLVRYSYVHYDGYPRWVGEIIVDLDADEVCDAVILRGDARTLQKIDGKCVHNPLNMGMRFPRGPVSPATYYGMAESHPADFAYLLKSDGTWAVWDTLAGCIKDLRQELGMPAKNPPSTVKEPEQQGYTKTMQTTNEIIGYRVQSTNDGMFINTHSDGYNYLTLKEPLPLSRADAYRRLAGFYEQNDATEDVFEVLPVYRVLTPLETTTKELSGLLSSLCSRHGLNLGLSQDQVEAKIAKELQELGASPIVDKINNALAR